MPPYGPHKTVVRFNNWKNHGGPCDLWITSCWIDVDVQNTNVPTATIYRRNDPDYAGLIQDWNSRFQRENSRGIGCAIEPWRRRAEKFCEKHGKRRPTSGLMLSYALKEMQIPFTVYGFTGVTDGHGDERDLFSYIGVDLSP